MGRERRGGGGDIFNYENSCMTIEVNIFVKVDFYNCTTVCIMQVATFKKKKKLNNEINKTINRLATIYP